MYRKKLTPFLDFCTAYNVITLDAIDAGLLRQFILELQARATEPRTTHHTRLFSRAQGVSPGEGAHLVHVRGGKSEAQKDLDGLREFIPQGAGVRGFSPRGWLGFKFGSGRERTRTFYDDLCAKLINAKVLEDTTKGRVLACSLANALAAFRLSI